MNKRRKYAETTHVSAWECQFCFSQPASFANIILRECNCTEGFLWSLWISKCEFNSYLRTSEKGVYQYMWRGKIVWLNLLSNIPFGFKNSCTVFPAVIGLIVLPIVECRLDKAWRQIKTIPSHFYTMSAFFPQLFPIPIDIASFHFYSYPHPFFTLFHHRAAHNPFSSIDLKY
jgi:hypothetical protein